MIKSISLKTVLPYLIIITSIVGLFASTILTYDQIKIWRNPNYSAPCALNPVLNCGSVINSNEGHVFGIPAPFFGLIMFPALATIGAVLASGAILKRWVWRSLQIAVMGGVLFAVWLFLISLYRINALCPYCLATDAAIHILAWYVTLFNLQQGTIVLPKRLHRLKNFVLKHHLDILISFFLLIAVIILQHFWYYYGRYFN